MIKKFRTLSVSSTHVNVNCLLADREWQGEEEIWPTYGTSSAHLLLCEKSDWERTIDRLFLTKVMVSRPTKYLVKFCHKLQWP